jgi:putative ABC transport system permease protein
MVVAAGVSMYVMYLSNFDSLRRTRAEYYDGARFADVFASLKRAPASLEERITAIPGVQVVATRVVADVTLDVPGMEEPASGRLISLPERGRPPLNDVYLRAARSIRRSRRCWRARCSSMRRFHRAIASRRSSMDGDG